MTPAATPRGGLNDPGDHVSAQARFQTLSLQPLQLAKDDATVRDFLAHCLSAVRPRAAKLRPAYAAGDTPEVAAIAHRLFIVARLAAPNWTSLEIAR